MWWEVMRIARQLWRHERSRAKGGRCAHSVRLKGASTLMRAGNRVGSRVVGLLTQMLWLVLVVVLILAILCGTGGCTCLASAATLSTSVVVSSNQSAWRAALAEHLCVCMLDLSC